MKLLQRFSFQDSNFERRLKLEINHDLELLAKATWIQLLYFQFGYPADIAYDLTLAKIAGLIDAEDLGLRRRY